MISIGYEMKCMKSVSLIGNIHLIHYAPFLARESRSSCSLSVELGIYDVRSSTFQIFFLIKPFHHKSHNKYIPTQPVSQPAKIISNWFFVLALPIFLIQFEHFHLADHVTIPDEKRLCVHKELLTTQRNSQASIFNSSQTTKLENMPTKMTKHDASHIQSTQVSFFL